MKGTPVILQDYEKGTIPRDTIEGTVDRLVIPCEEGVKFCVLLDGKNVYVSRDKDKYQCKFQFTANKSRSVQCIAGEQSVVVSSGEIFDVYLSGDISDYEQIYKVNIVIIQSL